MTSLLVVVHVAANLVWIGSITSVGFLLSQAASRADGKSIAEVALALYRRLAVPAFLASFVFGHLVLIHLRPDNAHYQIVGNPSARNQMPKPEVYC